MKKLDWKEYEKVFNWLSNYQQKRGNTFKTFEFKEALGLSTLDVWCRLNHLLKKGIIKRSELSRSHDILIPLTPEKLAEIKKAYIGKGTVLDEYEYKGEKLTVREIYDKYKPQMTLEQFSQRLRRGWTVKEALAPIGNRRNK